MSSEEVVVEGNEGENRSKAVGGGEGMEVLWVVSSYSHFNDFLLVASSIIWLNAPADIRCCYRFQWVN